MTRRTHFKPLAVAGMLVALAGMPALAQQTDSEVQATTATTAPADKAGTADNRAASSSGMRIGNGQSTREWMALQDAGTQASRQPQTLSGPVMRRIYDRYLESFTRPVPEWSTRRLD